LLNKLEILKQVIMKTASFHLSSILTVIDDKSVYNSKLSSFAKHANKYDVVKISGVTSIRKRNKYLSILAENGFTVVCENYNRLNYHADNTADFSISLERQANPTIG
jgi:hypothetical protein